ncbi:N-acetyl-alpha-D-glucosaminyl L-malate synthase BshA [candidate division KSB1 bacterium]|nr:N-acetyl-alpha-D-glucosaminyl L-malate synthase BshA [candidate division KSB1 bacterium]
MKVAMICYPTHGGSGVVATELGLELARLDHEVHFISYSAPFRLREFQQNVYYHEVEVSAYPLFKYPPYDLSLATKIVQVNKEHHLDIIHAHYAIPHATSAYLARQIMGNQHPKIITTLHGTDITLVGNDNSFFEAVKFSIEVSDGITAVSNYLAKRTKTDFLIEKDIQVIYNFIDSQKYNGAVSNCNIKRFAPHGEKIILHTSNFRKVKRLPDIVHVFQRVRKRMPCKLILVGEGPELQSTHQLVMELGISDDVLFLGTQHYMENILGCADLFLLPSDEESFGLAALEAMSCKTPVIGTQIGGITEVVDHGINGFLHPVGDIDGMAASAYKLLSNDNMLKKFKDAARLKAETAFDMQLIIPQYLEYYKKILQQNS